MARPVCGTICDGHRYRCKERHGTHILGRDGPSSNSRCPRHVLAALGCGWSASSYRVLCERFLTVARRYLLGLLRQCHCQRCPPHCLASPTWFGVHPILHLGLWYLFLPRVPSLAYEARPARQRIQINDTLAGSPNHRRKGLLLFQCDIRGGTERGSWCWLLCTLVGLFRST